MKINNKGQSLVTFVLIIPILFLIFLGIYDIGNMALLKQEVNDINYMAIDYAIDNITHDDVIDRTRELIIKNKNDIDNIDVSISDDKIKIVLEDTIDTKIFRGIFKIKSSYVGYMVDGKKIIERNK